MVEELLAAAHSLVSRRVSGGLRNFALSFPEETTIEGGEQATAMED
jgi:hypothetical protein